MDYNDVIDIFVNSICCNDDEFCGNVGNAAKLRLDVSSKFENHLKINGLDCLLSIQLFTQTLVNLLSQYSIQIIDKFITRLSEPDQTRVQEAKSSINFVLKCYHTNYEHACDSLLNRIDYNVTIIKEILLNWLSDLTTNKNREELNALSTNQKLLDWLNKLNQENDLNDQIVVNKILIGLKSSNMTNISQTVSVVEESNVINDLNSESFLGTNMLIIGNLVDINSTVDRDHEEREKEKERELAREREKQIQKDKELEKLKHQLKTVHEKLKRSNIVEKDDSFLVNQTNINNETVSSQRAASMKVYNQNVLSDQIDCQSFTNDSDLNMFFKQKLLDLLGNVWFNKGIKFQTDPINKKTFYYICKNNKIKAIRCPARCIVELNLLTNMACITNNAKSHTKECKAQMDKENEEKEKINVRKSKIMRKLIRSKKKKTKSIENKKSKVVKRKKKTSKTKNALKIEFNHKYKLRNRKAKQESSNKEDEQDEADLKLIQKSLNDKEIDEENSMQVADEPIEKDEESTEKYISLSGAHLKDKTDDSYSTVQEDADEMSEHQMVNLAEELISTTKNNSENNEASKKAKTSSIVIEKNGVNERESDNEETTAEVNGEDSSPPAKKKKTARKSKNETTPGMPKKSMPQKPKTVLSDKYSNNVVAEKVDCSSIQTESEYNDFFKTKLTELLTSNWTINGNARFISNENKIIHYYACVKNKSKAINCQMKCIIELDLNTKLAKFMRNSESHNHAENSCVNRLTLNYYQKNVIASNIDCRSCIGAKDYDSLFQQKLSEVLGDNWLKQNDTKIKEDENKSMYYYVCSKNKNKQLKCPSKCFIELDLLSNHAKFMHNSKSHNHPLDNFKQRTPRSSVPFSSYLNNVVSESIDCKYCKESNDYVLLFKFKLNEILGFNWEMTTQVFKPFKTSDENKVFYFACTNSNDKGAKCSTRCIVNLDTKTNTAKIMTNSRAHNHLL